jgi:hypothetical protein
VQVGAQWIIREMLLPQPGHQFGDSRSGVLRDALQDINEIGIRIDAVQSAGDDQTLDDSDVSGAEFGPEKKAMTVCYRSISINEKRGSSATMPAAPRRAPTCSRW